MPVLVDKPSIGLKTVKETYRYGILTRCAVLSADGDGFSLSRYPNGLCQSGTEQQGMAFAVMALPADRPYRRETGSAAMGAVNGTGRVAGIRWGRRWGDRLRIDGRRAHAPFADSIPNLPVAPIEAFEERQQASRRPAAAFVAQLLATRLDLPQSRDKDRAGADEAEASYHASNPDGRPTARGSIVRRDI
jgi:hypothetical protein